jgi:hypothetical protein
MLIIMMQWFRKIITKHNEEKQRRERTWKITLTDKYLLWRPNRYNPIELWYKWAELQTKILTELQVNFPDTYVYIRFSTFLPEHYKDIMESVQVEKISSSDKKEKVVLIPDCQDQSVWKRLLEGAGLVSYTRCFFMLKDKPPNWKEIISSLYEIITKLDEGHSFAEYESTLSVCPCLCFSLDEDLVIGKVDLPEFKLLDMLNVLAQEDGLEIDIERKP